ncbi:MAG: hypothetical protein CVV27_07200 [Candidatus Melainabacteria bacterium HGW-Melainabacteria-1]|nr:MAG: hypothetical protein CVV27_07200 [Candidatus Melainabacteria bacterium HGW-Melainabacteria-1]
MGLIGSEAALPELLRALSDSQAVVRRKAAEALGRIGSQGAIAGLRLATADPDKVVGKKAAEALGRISLRGPGFTHPPATDMEC